MNTNILQQFLAPYKEALEAICQQYHVAKLYVFGSVTTHAFQPQHSDIDLIVYIGEVVPTMTVVDVPVLAL